jgi:TRAP-type uncharacterized transport system fused permease subunit
VGYRRRPRPARSRLQLGQRPDHAAGDGRGGLPDGRVRGHPLFEVIKHAFLPAIISYIALFYIVHLEALKPACKPIGLPRRSPGTPLQRLALGDHGGRLHRAVGGGLLRHRLGQAAAGPTAGRWVIGAALLAAYVGPDVDQAARKQPTCRRTIQRPGLRAARNRPTLLRRPALPAPVVVLIWCLMVEQMSPALSAFWATLFMIFVMLTQRPLTALLRGQGKLRGPLRCWASRTSSVVWRPGRAT